MAGGHANRWTGEIAHAWVDHDGVFRAIVKVHSGKHWAPEPIVPGDLTAEALVGRRVRRVDGRWVLDEVQGAAS
jgi:hypothetical protein